MTGAERAAAIRDGRQLGSLEVFPGELRELYRLYASTVNVRAAERCRAVFGGNSAGGQLERILPQLADSQWTVPSISFACHQGFGAGGLPTSEAAGLVVRLTETLRPDPPPLAFGAGPGDGTWARYMLDVFEGDMRRDGGGASHLMLTAAADSDIDTLRDALTLLHRAWPDMAELVGTVVRQIIWFDAPAGTPRSRVPRSGVSAKVFGAIALVAGQDTVAALESAVHEATHLELLMRLSADKLVVNQAARGQSPFRSRPRPLVRVLHAAVVAARQSIAFRRCADVTSGDMRTRCLGGIRISQQALHQALTGLSEAQWTPTGARLAKELEACVKQQVAPAAGIAPTPS